jgi:hypothetical protein
VKETFVKAALVLFFNPNIDPCCETISAKFLRRGYANEIEFMNRSHPILKIMTTDEVVASRNKKGVPNPKSKIQNPK